MMPLLASDVCLSAAIRLNDQAQSDYTNTVLLPFVNDAYKELQLELVLNGSLALEKIEATVTLLANLTSLTSAGIYPSDLLEPQRLQERHIGETFWKPMTKTTWPPDFAPTEYNQYWSETQQDILVPGATVANQIRIFGIKSLPDITTAGDTIAINNAQPYMVNRVAALAARFRGNNKTRADALDVMAGIALSKLMGVNAKAKQGVRTRRRPFRITRRYWV
jgi:hypothetical protein